MSFYYADRDDKNGNKLITSYGNMKSAEKYGGADANIVEALWRGEFSDDLRRLTISESASGPVVRSYMKNSAPPAETSEGRYLLMGKLGGRWEPTSFRFTSYGAANTLMKSLIGAYEALVVIDEGEEVARNTKTSFDMNDL